MFDPNYNLVPKIFVACWHFPLFLKFGFNKIRNFHFWSLCLAPILKLFSFFEKPIRLIIENKKKRRYFCTMPKITLNCFFRQKNCEVYTTDVTYGREWLVAHWMSKVL